AGVAGGGADDAIRRRSAFQLHRRGIERRSARSVAVGRRRELECRRLRSGGGTDRRRPVRRPLPAMNAPARRPGGANRERSFGLSVGGVLLLIAALLVWRGRITRAEVVGAIGAVLVVFGALAPKLLKRPSDAWWAFAMAL